MSYPGSFFQDEASDSIVKETTTTSRRRTANSGRAPRLASNAHPQNSMLDLQQQQMQAQILPSADATWAFHQLSSNSNMHQTSSAISNQTDQAQVQTAPRGSRLEMNRVDEVYDASRQMYAIQEGYKGPELGEKNEPFAEYVFLVWRKIVPPPNPVLPPTIHTSIDVKSDYLKNLCQNIIGGFMGISWISKPLRVDPKAFIAYLPKLRAKAAEMTALNTKTEEESKALEHLEFLNNFISDEYSDMVNEINTYLTRGEITFDLLWAILLPQTPIYTECLITGEPRIVWLQNAVLQLGSYGLQTQAIEYNNGFHIPEKHGLEPKFGIADVKISPIFTFDGAVKINNLPSYPLEYHTKPDRVNEMLLRRGMKWVSLLGMHHMHYTGNAYYTTMMGEMGKLNIESRIMVDRKTLEEVNPNFPLPKVTKSLDFEPIKKSSALYSDAPANKDRKEVSLNETQLTFTSPVVYGFSLADKRWLFLNIEHVKTFEWNDEPFSNLVLNPATKDLIRVLVKDHSASESNFDDFVHGKGRGLVINLFGSPGVGKTLTAEATSEHVRKPLYVVGAADLGTDARTLDRELTRIFSVSAKWGAVVLIDEADVFLEERSLHDLERNAMVAVFLRQLEYFRGILFLTTNRVRTFDEAFLSRIHVSLRYHELDSSAKRQIWIAFIKKTHTNKGLPVLENAGLSEKELADLGDRDVNGRQIKNVVRTATSVANDRNEILGYKHLVQVLEILDQFDVDWNAVKRS